MSQPASRLADDSPDAPEEAAVLLPRPATASLVRAAGLAASPGLPLLWSLTAPVRSGAGAVLLVVAPHGGQERSRRNAWAAMAADAGRARARREATAAMTAAAARAGEPPLREVADPAVAGAAPSEQLA
jgi:hypothetical protein